MELRVNGKTVQQAGTICLAEFLAQRGFQPKRAIAEHNGAIIPSEQWGSVILQPEDRLEIVTFVGGG